MKFINILVCYLSITLTLAILQPYDLPPFPAILPDYYHPDIAQLYHKHIPRLIWVAVKDIKDELPGPLKAFFQRNSQWNVTICDNSCKDEFMSTVFADTSILWAYNAINPLVGAARADIWRYCVLYTYGGFYIDDDSDIKVPLDDIISDTDKLIMSEEGASSLGDCYLPSHHLSEVATYERYKHNVSFAKHFDGIDNATNLPLFFHGNTLINWAIFIMPRHPLMHKVISNIAEIIKFEYLQISVILMTRWDLKWKQVMCSTGFVLTYSTRQMELENSVPIDYFPRMCNRNFKIYQGNFKAISTAGDQTHYMKLMQRKNIPLLKSYNSFNMTLFLPYIEGKTVMGDGGKEIFLIQNRSKKAFPDYETFLKMKFSSGLTKHVPDTVLNLIPFGGVLKSLLHDEKEVKNNHNHAHNNNHNNAHNNNAHNNKIKVENIELFLLNVTKRINNMSVTCFGDDYAGTRDDYLKGLYDSLLGEVPAMVYPFCARTFQLGNTLGYYLNDVACADLSGAHFIAVHKRFSLIDRESLATQGDEDQLSFLNSLPDLIIHKNSKPPSEVRSIMKKECHCLQYCWENNEAPWTKRIPLIRQHILPSINKYMIISNALKKGTILSNVTDSLYTNEEMVYMPPSLQASNNIHNVIINNDNNNSNNNKIKINIIKNKTIEEFFLPFIPNVTIQYRCGDNIGFGKTRYGLIPFSAYNYNRIPLKTSQFIYIIADSPTRQSYHAYSHRCEIILHRLQLHLIKLFPKSTIVIKRGGDPFLDYARLVYSNVTICSASTFCLWPALSNNDGQVYFPLTPLVARSYSNETAMAFKPNFHWINDVDMIKEFKKYRPWSKLLDDLEA
eukprot:gene8204-11099_t